MIIGIDIRLIGKKRTGDEAVFFNLTKNLAKLDEKNEYKLFTDITDKAVLEKIKFNLNIEDKNNFEIISLESKNKFFWNAWILPKYLRNNPVDIYLTQYITPWFVPKKIKIITIIHDISFNFYPQFIKFWDLFFLKKLIPMSLKRADKILAVSEFTKNEIIKFYKICDEKIEWIHNAVSDDFLTQDVSEEKIKKVKEKYKLPENYILYLGTLQPRKNLPTLIDAYALLKLDSEFQRKNIKLVLAGGKGHNYDKNIDKIIKKSSLEKDVIFPGFIEEEDKAAIMKAANVFCFPSYYEGFGIPILEAMSLGVPVVASDILPHREIAGDSVMFFNPNIAGELTEAIQKIPSNEIIKNSLIVREKQQFEKFSWQKTAQKTIGIFESVK